MNSSSTEVKSPLLFWRSNENSNRLSRVAEWQRNGESGSLAHFALDVDLAAHEIDELFYDSQPQSGAAVFARSGSFSLLKLFKNMVQRFLLHADTGVCDRKL